MHIFSLSLVLLLLAPILSAAADMEKFTRTGMRWPTDASRIFTSTFGETRPGRFHAGLDISTNGTTGYPCYAVDDGDLIRMKVNFNGYGKVLYLRLHDGRIAVYAHLDRFNDQLDSLARVRQQDRGYYEFEDFFRKGEYSFKKGDIIAYTGETGAGPPHLHFELRHGMDVPYNPLLEGYYSPDSRVPLVKSVSIRPVDNESEVNGDILPLVMGVKDSKVEPVEFYGRVGISAKAYDFQDNTWYRLGIFRLELFVDGQLRHVTRLDSFDYKYNRHARLDFDFWLERNKKSRFRRLYKLEPNKLHFYDDQYQDGILDSRILGPGEHHIRIRAIDMAGNERNVEWVVNALDKPTLASASGNGPRPAPITSDSSTWIKPELKLIGTTLRVNVKDRDKRIKSLAFALSGTGVSFDMVNRGKKGWLGRAELPPSQLQEQVLSFTVVEDSITYSVITDTLSILSMKENDTATIVSPDSIFRASFHRESLWFPMAASFSVKQPESKTIAPVYSFRPEEVPFANPFNLSFTHPDSTWDITDVVCYRDAVLGGEWIYLGHRLEEDGRVLTSRSLSCEDFSVLKDTTAPEIVSTTPWDNGIIGNKKPIIVVKAIDDLTGLRFNECKLILDGEEKIWYFDQDKHEFQYRVESPLKKGNHEWSMLIVDNVGNRVEVKRKFRLK